MVGANRYRMGCVIILHKRKRFILMFLLQWHQGCDVVTKLV